MDDQASQQRQRGFIDRTNSAWNAGRTIYKGFKLVRGAGIAIETAPVSVPIMIALAVFLVLLVFFTTFTTGEGAELSTEGDTIGNDVSVPTVASDCPIPNGIVTCGSKNTPINGCGHCGVGYEAYSYECQSYYAKGSRSIDYSIDIGGSDLQPIYLPKINGNIIEWTLREQSFGRSEAIQTYTGVDKTTNAQYSLRFHHTETNSGNAGKHLSGEQAARICGNGCNKKHVHVELSGGNSSSSVPYLDAAIYFCKK